MPNLTIRKRKPRIAKNNPLNPNYALLRAKLERKMFNRQQKRISAGKEPLALPLTMVEGVAQRRAYGEGKLLLLDGKTQVRVPLVYLQADKTKAFLQGVYKLPTGELAVLRTTYFTGVPILKYFIRVKEKENYVSSFFCRVEDIAHNFLDEVKLEGMGLGVRAAAKAEKEYRAIGGEQPIWVASVLKRLYKKLHYRQVGKFPQHMVKTSKAYARDDLKRNHVIEAIDPVTGKQKTFSFHIKGGGI
jgi:hypothetical protein